MLPRVLVWRPRRTDGRSAAGVSDKSEEPSPKSAGLLLFTPLPATPKFATSLFLRVTLNRRAASACGLDSNTTFHSGAASQFEQWRNEAALARLEHVLGAAVARKLLQAFVADSVIDRGPETRRKVDGELPQARLTHARGRTAPTRGGRRRLIQGSGERPRFRIDLVNLAATVLADLKRVETFA